MVTLGVMSYSIYLWQQPFFNTSSAGILTSTPFNFIGLAMMTLISYFLVEKPSLKLRHKIEKKIFRKKSLPALPELELQPSGNS
jgi:peptidoglycan/LPS O-acetylase OafA/YrhL